MILFADKFFWTATFGYGFYRWPHSLRDYSSEFRFDQLLNYMSAGTSLKFSIQDFTRKYVFDFTFTPSVGLTNPNPQFLARIGDEQNLQSIRFRSTNFALQPDFTISRKFGPFGVPAMVGYNFAF